jgi:hypothetical protein
MNSKELIKLDENIMECFDQDEMLIVKGGSVWQIIKDIFTGDTNTNCPCPNTNCPCS